MEEVLREKKKKLVIRMKNYRFTSVNDIFEGRDNRLKDFIHQNINHSQKASMIQRETYTEERPKKEPSVRINAWTKVTGWHGDGNKPKHKPYQRKIVQS